MQHNSDQTAQEGKQSSAHLSGCPYVPLPLLHYKLLLLAAAKNLHIHYLQLEACLRFIRSWGWLCLSVFPWICEFCVYVFLRRQPHVRERSSGVFSQDSLFKFKSVMGSYLDTTWSEPWYELLKMSRADECWPASILGANFPLYIWQNLFGSVSPVLLFLSLTRKSKTMYQWINCVIHAEITNQTNALVWF